MSPVRPTARCRRSRIFIDREVQGALMLRVGFYWFCCLLSIVLMVICWNVVNGPRRPFADLVGEIYERYAPALVASLILLPMVMIDVLRLSHRFVGPVVRLRGGLRELATQGRAKPITLRDGDYWQELAADFNRVAERAQLAGTPTKFTADELLIDDRLGPVNS